MVWAYNRSCAAYGAAPNREHFPMADPLTILARPTLKAPTLIMGFSGWMDGGDVSTGTIEYLIESLEAQPLAEIAPNDFYILNFPGSMEVTALFRPEVTIEDGLITSFGLPENRFYYVEDDNLILFSGREPNFGWQRFAQCFFDLVSTFGVVRMLFIGSVAGVVPHTRDPRLYGAMSKPELREFLEKHDVRPSNYEGPASFTTALMAQAGNAGISMASLVAEVPPYVQGRNVKCIEAVCARLLGMLELDLDLEELTGLRHEFERRLNEVVEEREDLAELVTRMEKEFDAEIRDEEMHDLKAWFEKQNIRLD